MNTSPSLWLLSMVISQCPLVFFCGRPLMYPAVIGHGLPFGANTGRIYGGLTLTGAGGLSASTCCSVTGAVELEAGEKKGDVAN